MTLLQPTTEPVRRGPIEVVRQLETYGCAAGALATLLGVTYDAAKQIIPQHKCRHVTCSKCRRDFRRDRARYPGAEYMACSGHLASILRTNGFKTEATMDIYSQDVYPVLVKIAWFPRSRVSHFFIWDPQAKLYLCPSGRVQSREHEPVDQLFSWADEPAYIVKHPKYLPLQVAMAA